MSAVLYSTVHQQLIDLYIRVVFGLNLILIITNGRGQVDYLGFLILYVYHSFLY